MQAVALTPRETFLAVAIAAMIGCALVSFFLTGRVTARTHVALAMLIALIGGFSLFALLGPLGQENPAIGALIVLALIGLFKLMNQFEIRRGRIARTADRCDRSSPR
jgi:CHASE2 domain-containing sensor protein